MQQLRFARKACACAIPRAITVLQDFLGGRCSCRDYCYQWTTEQPVGLLMCSRGGEGGEGIGDWGRRSSNQRALQLPFSGGQAGLRCSIPPGPPKKKRNRRTNDARIVVGKKQRHSWAACLTMFSSFACFADQTDTAQQASGRREYLFVSCSAVDCFFLFFLSSSSRSR